MVINAAYLLFLIKIICYVNKASIDNNSNNYFFGCIKLDLTISP